MNITKIITCILLCSITHLLRTSDTEKKLEFSLTTLKLGTAKLYPFMPHNFMLTLIQAKSYEEIVQIRRMYARACGPRNKLCTEKEFFFEHMNRLLSRYEKMYTHELAKIYMIHNAIIQTYKPTTCAEYHKALGSYFKKTAECKVTDKTSCVSFKR